jgi:hypothetical protein
MNRLAQMILAVAFLAACPSTTPPAQTTPNPPAPTEEAKPEEPEEAEPVAPAELSAEGERVTRAFTELLEEAAAVMTRHGQDCPKIAAAIEPMVLGKIDVLGDYLTVSFKLPRDEQQLQKERYGARIDAASKTISDVEALCKDDPAYKAMQERLKKKVND